LFVARKYPWKDAERNAAAKRLRESLEEMPSYVEKEIEAYLASRGLKVTERRHVLRVCEALLKNEPFTRSSTRRGRFLDGLAKVLVRDGARRFLNTFAGSGWRYSAISDDPLGYILSNRKTGFVYHGRKVKR